MTTRTLRPLQPARSQISDPDLAVRAWLRVPVFTAASLALGIVGHLWAGGGPPGPGALTLLVGVVGLISLRLADRERRLPELVLAVALVQAAVHVALLDRSEAAPMLHPAAMTLAHAVAAVALAWWLRRGEAAVWASAARLLRRLTGRFPVPPPLPRAVPRLAPNWHRPDPLTGPRPGVRTVRGPPTA